MLKASHEGQWRCNLDAMIHPGDVSGSVIRRMQVIETASININNILVNNNNNSVNNAKGGINVTENSFISASASVWNVESSESVQWTFGLTRLNSVYRYIKRVKFSNKQFFSDVNFKLRRFLLYEFREFFHRRRI